MLRPSPIHRTLYFALVGATAFTTLFSFGQNTSPLQVDATVLSQAAPTSFRGGTATNPSGHTIGMNARYLTVDGKPWLPVMGEFHYTRVPEAEWEAEILKMKSSGVDIIATYVIWSHHEEIEGKFDWTGRRDLRHFVELCAKHQMYVYPRIGPWAHGEVRNGGFPDWLLKKTTHTRENDPIYLEAVGKYFNQVSEQLKGLLWKDGGPIIGLQLENEYAKRGENAGEAYILRLKQLAQSAGLDVPIYSLTGWDNAVLPHGEFVAVFGGYPDAPWDASLTDLPAEEVYVFRFNNRVTGSMGVVGAAHRKGDSAVSYDFPFMTAEMGGGIQSTYHRRPVLQPDDVASMMPVMLGSGVNLYGSYMFQGGENPDGKLTTLQESQATGYPTDVPVKTYDFQAPLSEFGEERQVLRKEKIYNYFLNDFGPRLAPMETYAPNVLPSGPDDTAIPRWSVRSDGRSGYLFFNNYARNLHLPERKNFQVQIKLPRQTILLPTQPVDLPAGTYGFWPFGLQMGTVELRYATAQLFTHVVGADHETYYFVATKGVPSQFAFEKNPSLKIAAPGAQIATDDGMTVITPSSTSLASAIQMTDGVGKKINVVLLSQEDAENTWKVGDPPESLLITKADFYADGNIVHLLSQDPHFNFQMLSTDVKINSDIALKRRPEGSYNHYSATIPTVHPEVKVTPLERAKNVPPVRIGPPATWRGGVALAPDDTAFSNAASWQLTVPRSDWTGVKDLFLNVAYDGDVARLSAKGLLLDDDFYSGTIWRVGLNRFKDSLANAPLVLQILPRRNDAPIFLEKPYRSTISTGQVMTLKSVTITPQYELVLTSQK